MFPKWRTAEIADAIETTVTPATVTEMVAEAPSTTTATTTIDPVEFQRTKEALKAANAESAARRKELETLRKEKADREQAEMTELERTKLEAATHQAKASEYEKELTAIKAERAFEKSVQKLGLTFQSETAREDAYKFIDASDPANIEKELKRVTTERPYLLKTTTTPNLDATATGKQTAPDDKYLEEIRKRYNIRA